jgi:ATP-binding cassette subfamily C protein CydCD
VLVTHNPADIKAGDARLDLSAFAGQPRESLAASH